MRASSHIGFQTKEQFMSLRLGVLGCSKIVGLLLVKSIQFEARYWKKIQDKKLSYTWNVDEYPDSPETIVTWMIESLDGGSSSEIKLVHSDLADNVDGLERRGSYFIGRFAEHCKDKQQCPPT